MAAGPSNARPIPIKNAELRVYFEIRKNDGTLISGATALTAVLSKDGATPAAANGTVTEIGTSGMYYLDMLAAEVNYDCVILKVTSSSTGAVPVVLPLYPTLGDGTEIPVDVQAVNGDYAAANQFAKNLAAAYTMSVDDATYTPTTSDFECDASLWGQEADYWKGRSIVFLTPGINLLGEAAVILGSTYTANSKVKLTVKTLTTAPPNDAEFVIL